MRYNASYALLATARVKIFSSPAFPETRVLFFWVLLNDRKFFNPVTIKRTDFSSLLTIAYIIIHWMYAILNKSISFNDISPPAALLLNKPFTVYFTVSSFAGLKDNLRRFVWFGTICKILKKWKTLIEDWFFNKVAGGI